MEKKFRSKEETSIIKKCLYIQKKINELYNQIDELELWRFDKNKYNHSLSLRENFENLDISKLENFWYRLDATKEETEKAWKEYKQKIWSNIKTHKKEFNKKLKFEKQIKNLLLKQKETEKQLDIIYPENSYTFPHYNTIKKSTFETIGSLFINGTERVPIKYYCGESGKLSGVYLDYDFRHCDIGYMFISQLEGKLHFNVKKSEYRHDWIYDLHCGSHVNFCILRVQFINYNEISTAYWQVV